MFGGLQSLRWGVSNHGRRKFPAEVLAGLERRLLLFYSGQSRNSGINNWALYKSFIDRQADVRERFAGIALATRELETALDRLDWTAAGEAIAREWEIRRTLAAGISTPAMNEAFALAQALAPVSGKICGAGGGGCFFLYASGLADAGGEALRAKLIEAVTASGIQSLPFRATPTGLTIEETRDEGPA